MRRVVLICVAVLATAVWAETALAAYTPAVWDAADEVWTTTRTAAAHNVMERFPNATHVACVPQESRGNSQVIGTVRYWDTFGCGGSLRVGHPSPGKLFFLQYFVVGKCGTCWTIATLENTSIAALKRTPPAPKTPWYWSEGLANNKISHSMWFYRQAILDPESVDCGGYGSSITKNDLLLYQHFRCSIEYGGGPGYWVYRVDVTGRDTFKIVQIGSGVRIR